MFDQQGSVEKMHQAIDNVLADRFPIKRKNYRISIRNRRFKDVDSGFDAQESHFDNKTSLEQQLVADLVVETFENADFTDADKPLSEDVNKGVALASFPYPTNRGTYILGGNEKVFLHQNTLRPGLYTHPLKVKTGNNASEEMIRGEIRGEKNRYSMVLDVKKGNFYIDKPTLEFLQDKNPKRVDGFSFFRLIGITDAEIQKACGNDARGKEIFKTLSSNAKIDSIEDTHEKVFQSPYESDDASKAKASAWLEQAKFDASSQKINKITTGKDVDKISKEAFLATFESMIKEIKQPGSSPKIDDPRFKRVYTPETMIARNIDKGIGKYFKDDLKHLNYSPFKADHRFFKNPSDKITRTVRGSYSDSLCEPLDTGNPLDLHQKLRKMTMVGDFGLPKEAIVNENRNLLPGMFGKVDPVETPQSGSMGITEYLARDAEVKNGYITSKYFRVKNGVVDASKVIDDIDPIDEYDEYIAFNIPENYDIKGTQWTLKTPQVRVRHQNRFVEVPKNKVTLIDRGSSSHLSHSVGLIPFGANNDGARMLMGASMQKQALQLSDAEAPIVQSMNGVDDRTVEQEISDNISNNLRSPVDGIVSSVSRNEIVIRPKDGSDPVRVKKLNYWTTGKNSGYINHKDTVKAGDKVKANDLIADGWQSKNGQFALGKNALVAFMPFEGYNFEDGVVVSESYANRMTSEEVKTREVKIDKQRFFSFLTPYEHVTRYDDVDETGKKRKKSRKEIIPMSDLIRRNITLREEADKLDSRGLIKVGMDFEEGDVFVALLTDQLNVREEKEAKSAVVKSKQARLADRSIRAQGYEKGKIVDVKVVDDNDEQARVVIKYLTFNPMKKGDKLSGRHGNKGTITEIRSDKEMPHTEDGKPIELIFSPLAIPSRKNLGQLFEVNAGMLAMKKGMDTYKVKNFDSRSTKNLLNEMKEAGMEDGKVTLINPKTGKPYESKVTVGPMYILKLKHKVDGKISQRSTDVSGRSVDPVTNLPRKLSGSIDGERTSPQAIGGMEFWSLTSAGAVENIHEMTTIKSDGARGMSDRRNVFEAIANGVPVPKPVTPQTVLALSDLLAAGGINMTPLKEGKKVSLDEQFTSLMLTPLGQKNKMFNGVAEVQNGHLMNANTKGGEIIGRPGGLYDESIFGENQDQWGKITLDKAVPNPMFLTQNSPPVYEALLASKDIKRKQLKELADGKLVYIKKTSSDSSLIKGQLVPLTDIKKAMAQDEDDIDFSYGAGAFEDLLADVDIEKELEFAKNELKDATKPADKSKWVRATRMLTFAVNNGLTPQDYLLKEVPVLPVKYRAPVRSNESNTVADDGLTLLYSKLVTQAKPPTASGKGEQAEETSEQEKIEDAIDFDDFDAIKDIVNTKAAMFSTLSSVVGTKDYHDPKTGIEYKGILNRLSAKSGFLREKMQKKPQDYSGRSVIIVDPTLDLDEVSLPEDMAREIFKPYIYNELRGFGITNRTKQEYEWRNRTPKYRAALEEVVKSNPVVLNRAPSLHRHSVQAFNAKINWEAAGSSKKASRAIGLNAIVTTPYNADFDGDTMSVHVPLSKAAKEEAYQKLMPSKNLLNPTNNSLIMELKHEMQLGIFYSTRKKPMTQVKNMNKPYKNFDALMKAYEAGEVKTYDTVQATPKGMGMKQATVGQHLFNMALAEANVPTKYIDYDKNVDMGKKKLTKLLTDILADDKGGSMIVTNVLNKLRNVGFKTATYSGMSIGIGDFNKVSEINKEDLFKQSMNSPDVKAAEEKMKAADNAPIIEQIALQQQFEQARTRFVQGQIKTMVGKGDALSPDNPVAIMMASGARGNAGQITGMAGIVGVGKDVENKATDPVNRSLLEGLRPNEFFTMSADSRKGIFDKSIATRDPGALTRQIWFANRQSVISEEDCHDQTGVLLHLKEVNGKSDVRHLRGRILLEPLKFGGQIITPSKKPITLRQFDEIMAHKKDLPETIKVRSPLTCKASHGTCQQCYGARPGDMKNELVPIGEPIGSIAAQALGEPSQQAIMRTFHSGAGDSNSGNAFKRIQDVLELSSTKKPDTAVLAQSVETITKIEKDNPILGTRIHTDKTKPSKPYNIGRLPISPDLRVGLQLHPGDSLTDLKGTFRDPRDVLETEGIDGARNYLIDSVTEAFRMGDIDDTDRRHLEVTVNNMTNRATVMNPGSSSFMEGQTVTRSQIDNFNKRIDSGRVITVPLARGNRDTIVGKKAGQTYTDPKSFKDIVKNNQIITDDMFEKLLGTSHSFVKIKDAQGIKATPTLFGVQNDTQMADGRWLGHTAFRGAKQHIQNATAFGLQDDLSDALTRQMTGKKGNFAENFTPWLNEQKERYGDMF